MAFDTVIRDALWLKLSRLGISCKMLNMLKAIYHSVKSFVRILPYTDFSETFDVTIGLKQGEPLSLILFILFINDISNALDFSMMSEKDLNYLSLYMLLFADAIVLFTTDPHSLQSQLDAISNYSSMWELKINVDKTKICIFESRKSRNDISWFIYDKKVETVDHFRYLNVDFLYTGNMKNSVKVLHDQALRAYNCLLSLFSRIQMDVKTKLSFFDKLVVPILLYCSEVWGVYNYRVIDNLHLKFCKIILVVNKQTSNTSVLGELGRYPLSLICKERVLKKYIKIMNNENSRMPRIFIEQLNSNNEKCWAYSVKKLIDNLGFSNIWNNLDKNANYLPLLKQRLRDQYLQNWQSSVHELPKLSCYRQFKTNFGREKYTDIIRNDFFEKNAESLSYVLSLSRN